MIKSFALIVRRLDHTREAFRKHYEEIHAPTALPLTRELARSVRYQVEVEIHGTPVFDVISAFWYPSGKETAATVARIAIEGLDSLPSWIAGREQGGASICAVRTRRHETNLGNAVRAAE